MLAAFLNSLNAVTLIMMMVAVGFILGKLKLMRTEHKSFIIKYVVNIAVPAMCIVNVFEQFAKLEISNPFLLFLPPICSMLTTIGIAIVATKIFHVTHKKSGAFVIMCALSNSMFIGLPMCKELFGNVAIPYVIIVYIINTMMFWSIGVALLQRSSMSPEECKKLNILETLKNLATPPLISLLVSIILVMIGVKSLPHIVTTFCGYFSNTISPLILTYVGFIISETDFKKIKIDLKFIFVILMRFVISPLIMLGFCKIFSLPELTTDVFVAEASMPIMTQCIIMTATYGGDEEYVASSMTISTILCVVFIPLLMLFLEAI